MFLFFFSSYLCLTFLHRNQVKTEYLMSLESSEILLEEIGAQALATAAYQPPDAVLQAIDAVTLDSVVQASGFIVATVILYERFTLVLLCNIFDRLPELEGVFYLST